MGLEHIFLDLIENEYESCPGAIAFYNGANFAAGSIRMHNIGDISPQAIPTGHYTTTAVLDPPLLGIGQSASVDVSFTGASLGNVAVAGFDGTTSGTLQISAYVIAANLVRVTITNQGPSDVDLPSGMLRVKLWKFD